MSTTERHDGAAKDNSDFFLDKFKKYMAGVAKEYNLKIPQEV